MSQYLEKTLSLRCVEVTGQEPVSLADAKQYLRLDTDDDDTIVQGAISAARAHAEAVTRRVLRRSRWLWLVDGLDPEQQVPLSPCEFCTKIAQNGVVLDPAEYDYRAGDFVPIFGVLTVSCAPLVGETEVELVAGYEDGKVPPDIVKYIMIRMADFYEQRESFAVGQNFHEFGRDFVKCLLDPYLILDV